MAVDTEAKRWSMLAFCSGSRTHVFNPDTSGLSSIEKITVLQHYGGIPWSEAVVVAVEAATTGWKFLMEFDTFRKKRDEEQEERKKALEAIEALNAPDREIGQLLQQDIAAESRKEQISELQRIIARNATAQDLAATKAHNDKIARAFVRAAVQKNFSAVEALEREMDRKIEEDEFLMLAFVMLC